MVGTDGTNGIKVWLDGTGVTQVLGKLGGMRVPGITTPVVDEMVRIFDDGKVDGNKVTGTTTGVGPNVSGISKVVGTGGGVEMV